MAACIMFQGQTHRTDFLFKTPATITCTGPSSAGEGAWKVGNQFDTAAMQCIATHVALCIFALQEKLLLSSSSWLTQLKLFRTVTSREYIGACRREATHHER